MPGKNYYRGMAPGDQLRAFIAHHHDHKTRHISKDEAAMLEDMADTLDKDDNNGSAQGSHH